VQGRLRHPTALPRRSSRSGKPGISSSTSRVLSCWKSTSGETERYIRLVFQRAREKVPVIVFFDEMDSIFRSRSSGVSGNVENTIIEALYFKDFNSGQRAASGSW